MNKSLFVAVNDGEKACLVKKKSLFLLGGRKSCMYLALQPNPVKFIALFGEQYIHSTFKNG